jgi:hypothetical protein
MNFRNLSAWSIRNPVVPIVLFLGSRWPVWSPS